MRKNLFCTYRIYAWAVVFLAQLDTRSYQINLYIKPFLFKLTSIFRYSFIHSRHVTLSPQLLYHVN